MNLEIFHPRNYTDFSLKILQNLVYKIFGNIIFPNHGIVKSHRFSFSNPHGAAFSIRPMLNISLFLPLFLFFIVLST